MRGWEMLRLWRGAEDRLGDAGSPKTGTFNWLFSSLHRVTLKTGKDGLTFF